MNLRLIYNELSPHVMKGDNTLYRTKIGHGDEFVWDEFVGDELLGDESSGSLSMSCMYDNNELIENCLTGVHVKGYVLPYVQLLYEDICFVLSLPV